jgi:hypothetical protein
MLHNVVHLVVDAPGIALSTRRSSALRFLEAAGLASLGLPVLGVAGGLDWLPVNNDDNWLHLVLGTGAIALGYLAAPGAGAVAVAGAPSRL